MKVILSDKAYFKPTTEDLWKHCCDQTTYQVQNNNSPYPVVYKNSGKIGDNLVWIPVTRLDILESMGYKLQIIDKRITVPVELPTPLFKLREDQDGILQEFTKVGKSGVGIVNGKPGFGKTILALALAFFFGQKTLVVCTNVGIRRQWEKEIEKWFGFTPGVIGSGLFNTDPMIVVANIQTLNKHANKVSKMFGTVIVDEVHHCVATTFSNFLEKTHARYRIGLSGTLKRKDGLNVMFKDYFGFDIYSPAVSNTLPPTIHKYRVDLEISGNNLIPWATRANVIYDSDLYRDLLIELTYIYYRAGHKVLVVSDRTELINLLHEIMDELRVPVFSIKGSTPLEERDLILENISQTSSCVLVASQSIFSEGISQDDLSCLILGSIINNESLIEQLAGRVQRISEGKLPPVVVDIALEGGTGWNQAKGRISTYRNNGWDIVDMVPERFDEFKRNVFAEE